MKVEQNHVNKLHEMTNKLSKLINELNETRNKQTELLTKAESIYIELNNYKKEMVWNLIKEE